MPAKRQVPNDGDQPMIPSGRKTITPKICVPKIKGQEIAMIIDGPDRTEVSDFGGGKSRSTMDSDGQARIVTSGRLRRGRTNEGAVVKVLRQCLKDETGSMPFIVRASDERGEDARLRFPDGTERVVQIVTTPPDPEYGAAIARGSSEREIPASEAASWIRSSIEFKRNQIPEAGRRAMILALDARHAGLLSESAVLAELAANGPPTTSYGFAEIWLVGPIPSRSCRLA